MENIWSRGTQTERKLPGTNEYSIVRITRNTAEECLQELEGQLSDGIFENSRVGVIEEIQ